MCTAQLIMCKRTGTPWSCMSVLKMAGSSATINGDKRQS
jgi:hypothetical protein